MGSKKKYLASAAAFVLSAALMVPGMAFADSENDNDRDTASHTWTSSDTPLDTTAAKGAATRAAMPSLEILGINSVEESGQFITMMNGVPQYEWSQPKYFLAASKFNSSPSTYLVNLALNQGTKAAYNPSRSIGGGPNSALAVPGDDTTDDAVWAFLPDVVVGNNGSVEYADDEYDLGYGYEPGVNYNANSYSTLIQTMNNIGTVVTNANKSGRYASTPAQIATAYGNYINGTIGYIQSQVPSSNYKDIVLITGVSGSSAGNYTYTVAQTGSGSDGTASQNRYLETVDAVTNNYANDHSVTSMSSFELQRTDLVDVILVGGQQGSSDTDTIVAALKADNILYKTYYVESNGSQGSMYGVVMNSVENAQNIGRILGFIYPNVISQSEFVAYYYDQFYHINIDDIPYVMSQAMDGVRNANVTGHTTTTTTVDGVGYTIGVDSSAMTLAASKEWTMSDVTYTTTTQSNVATKISAGLSS